MSQLFSPCAWRSLALSNRIAVSPMCQYSAVDGKATAWHLMHLGSLAMSGAGLLCIEATAVEADGRISPSDLGLWDDATEQALQPVLAFIREHSPIKVAIQLAHAGRKASTEPPWNGGHAIAASNGGWVTHAPSAIPYQSGGAASVALDADGLARVRSAFVESARRAMRLGIDAIELHAAHGYLLHQFLSPLANHREDSYGGSLANRMRFPLEVFDAVRAVTPETHPLGVRVSSTDWVEGGWDLEQTLEFAAALKARGVDYITASSGGLSPQQKIALGPGYQVPFARAIKQATGVHTIAVGLITDAQQAEDILAQGDADSIALARAMLYDARWPWHAAAQLGASVDAPPQYWRAPPHGVKGLFRGSSS